MNVKMENEQALMKEQINQDSENSSCPPLDREREEKKQGEQS
jgi:hypothetical protein